jgi:uncharacterized protein YoxC
VLQPTTHARQPVDTCSSCGKQIGKNETPSVWGDRIVCRDCYTRHTATPTAPNAPEMKRSGALSAWPQMAGVSVAAAIVTLAVFYLVVVQPLRQRLAQTETTLRALRDQTTSNTDELNAAAKAMQDDRNFAASLAQKVNHNAEAADRAASALANDLNSLTAAVNLEKMKRDQIAAIDAANAKPAPKDAPATKMRRIKFKRNTSFSRIT